MMVSRTLLLMGCALLLASCGGSGTPAVQPPSSLEALSGRVVENVSTDAGVVTGAWSGGAGSVVGEITLGSGTTATTEVLTTADLAADGQFTLTLPAGVDGAKLHAFTGAYFDVGAQAPTDGGTSMTCTGTPTLSSSSVHGVTLAVKVRAGKSGSLMSILPAPAGAAPGALQIGSVVYVDGPLTVKGTVACTSASAGTQATVSVTYDLKLASGWNELTITEANGGLPPSGSTSAQAITLTSGTLPTDQWLFSPYTAVVPVGPDALNPAR